MVLVLIGKSFTNSGCSRVTLVDQRVIAHVNRSRESSMIRTNLHLHDPSRWQLQAWPAAALWCSRPCRSGKAPQLKREIPKPNLLSLNHFIERPLGHKKRPVKVICHIWFSCPPGHAFRTMLLRAALSGHAYHDTLKTIWSPTRATSLRFCNKIVWAALASGCCSSRCCKLHIWTCQSARHACRMTGNQQKSPMRSGSQKPFWGNHAELRLLNLDCRLLDHRPKHPRSEGSAPFSSKRSRSDFRSSWSPATRHSKIQILQAGPWSPNARPLPGQLWPWEAHYPSLFSFCLVAKSVTVVCVSALHADRSLYVQLSF